MMLNKSIAYRLTVYISIAVIVTFVAFMVFSYIFNSQTVIESIESRTRESSTKAVKTVEIRLITTQEVASNLANQILFYARNDKPDLLLKGVLKKYPFIKGIQINLDNSYPLVDYHDFIAYRNKDSIIYQQADSPIIFQSETVETLYEDLRSKSEPEWSGQYICPRDSERVISFYNPFKVEKENGISQRVGEIFCTISLDELNDTINNIQFENDGFAFLLAKNGKYITHPIRDYVENREIFSLPDRVYDKNKTNVRQVLEKGLSGSLVSFPEYTDFQKHWVFYTRLEIIDWTMVFSVPYNLLFRELYLSIIRMLLASVLGIIIIAIIIRLITKRLVEPLSNVTSQLQKFSSETGSFEANTLNEVKLVSESLTNLKSWYEKLKIDHSTEEKKYHQQMEDLVEASEIQLGLINKDFSVFTVKKEVDLFSLYKPARVVSGDLYDFIFLDDDHLLLTIGDVSGKGIPAAFFMSVAQTIIKSNAASLELEEIVEKVNHELFTNNTHQFFLTLFMGILNVKTGILKYCNAAHTTSILLKEDGSVIDLVQTHGLPLGLYPDKKYSTSEVYLERNDSIVMYTDGVTDLQDEHGVHYGMDRFMENLAFLKVYAPVDLINRMEKSFAAFKGNAQQSDDITLMIAKYKG